MKKGILKGILIVVFLLVAGTVFASAKPKLNEEQPKKLKQVINTREYSSENGARKVIVEYEDTCVRGNARYIIKDKNDRILAQVYHTKI